MDREEGDFARFLDLPYGVRCEIWAELMPAHGIYLVECESVIVDRTDDQDGHKTSRLALRPARHKFHACGHEERVRTQKILLATCAESRWELCRRFPDTLGGGGPRLSFRHDLVYIVSDFLSQQPLVGLSVRPELHLEFEGGWNELIHRLALDCEYGQPWHVLLRGPAGSHSREWHSTRIARFMEFLTTCTSLRQLVLTSSDGIGFDSWAELPRNHRMVLAESMAACYGGLTCQASEQLDKLAGALETPASLLRRLILDDLDDFLHPAWAGKVKGGYPVLRDLEISKMLHVSRELRWLCKEL